MSRNKIDIDPQFDARAKHASVECTAQRLEHNLDEAALGRGPALAIAAAIAAGIRAISAPARDGKRKLFNRTGRLAAGIAAHPARESWEVAAPPDRLQDPKLVARLRDVVPALADPLGPAPVRTAIEQTVRDHVTVGLM